MLDSLVQAFETARGDRTPSDATVMGLELRRAYEDAAAAWPGVAVDAQAFARALGAIVRGEDALAELREVHAVDVYLACACIAGDTTALRIFGQVHLARVREWVHHV